ncbi:MAG: hypothetical protein Q7O66_07345 [Dehalococcoidia bacterium]|nr:hypothetical protein [Dehalococcoidia bacterium]
MMQRPGMMEAQGQPQPDGGQGELQQIQQMLLMLQKNPAMMGRMMTDPAMKARFLEMLQRFLELQARGSRPPNGFEVIQQGLAAAPQGPQGPVPNMARQALVR